jgi:hypothetical protein
VERWQSKGPRITRSQRLIVIISAGAAVLAVGLEWCDALLAREEAPAAASQLSLAVDTTASLAGFNHAFGFRCAETNLRLQLAHILDARHALEAQGLGTELDAVLARVTTQSQRALAEVGASLGAPLDESLGLYPASVEAVNHAECTEASVTSEGKRAGRILATQNSTAQRVGDLGRGRARVTMALALLAVGAAVLSLAQATRSARPGRRGRGLGLAIIGTALVSGAALWGVSGLLAY